MPSDTLPPIRDIESLLGASRADSDRSESEPTRGLSLEPSRFFWLAVLGLALALGLFALYRHWVPNKWLFGDGSFYMNVVRGLLEHGSLRQETLHPHSWYDRDLGWNQNLDAAWSNIALGRHGEWWPKHPFLMPLVAAPFVWAFGPVGSLVFQFACYLLMALLAYRIASRLAARPAALAAAAAFVATPWVYDRVWGFNNDVFYSVLILAAVDAALDERPEPAGLLLGIGVFAKATNVFYGPALLGLFLLRRDWRGAVRLCAFAAGPALLYLASNWYLYGSPFHTGYDRILVREAGHQAMHSHAADFHFRELLPSLRRVLLGGEGFAGQFPLFFPALLGLGALALRRWREALALAWCLLVPIAFHAPYAWYRLEFNLPQIALSVAPLAALLPPFAPPSDLPPERRRLRWGRVAPVLVIGLLLLAGLARRAFSPLDAYFWAHLPSASVSLGDVPCDYFNNQTERWECSHLDSDLYMTGRPLERPLTYGGKVERLLLFHPHPSGRERKLTYEKVPLSQVLELSYGLADGSRPDAAVRFQVFVDGKPLHDEEVKGTGLTTRKLDTSAYVGREATVTFVVQAARAERCLFGVNGAPSSG